MTRIVGIGGKLASGKDAVSDHLVENHGWLKLGMSDALADALYTLNPWIPTGIDLNKPTWKQRLAHLIGRGKDEFTAVERYQDYFNQYGYVRVKENDEVRRLLQILGTEVGRKQISESIWTDIMERKVREGVAAGYPGVIVTGVRFPNEIEAISDNLGGELWWVSRPSLAAGSNAGHASENSVNAADFDTTIVNDGSLLDLYAKVDRLVT